MNRKIISLLLVLCMILSSVAVGSFVTNAAADDAETVSAAGTEIQLQMASRAENNPWNTACTRKGERM